MITVHTQYGILEGERNFGYSVFRGIPYAAAPTGKRRFAPAGPPEAWNGTRKAVQFGPPPVQMSTGEFSILPVPLRSSREDCLFANVSTPAPLVEDSSGEHPDSSAHLPVYLFLHGGGFDTGGSNLPLYSGKSFVQKGIVYVSVNYRLGVFGCLELEALETEHPSSGGYSITDVIQAVRWIHENIEQFGGDPENVTIGGESAGAGLTSMLMQTDYAGSLFQRCIMESGSARGFVPNSRAGQGSVEWMLHQGQRLAASFGVKDNKEGLDCLRKKTAEELACRWYFTEDGRRQSVTSDPLMVGTVFQQDVIPDPRKQKLGSVDLLYGYNTDDGSMFAGLNAVRSKYEYLMHKTFPDHAEEIMRRYPADDASAFRVLSDVITTLVFRSPVLAYADPLADQGRNVFVYHFDYLTEKLREEKLGVRHIAELYFVFDKFLDFAGGDDVKGRSVAKLMNAAWCGFIKYGDPNIGIEEEGLDLQGQKWNPYDTVKREVFRIGRETGSERIERLDELQYFDRLLTEEYR